MPTSIPSGILIVSYRIVSHIRIKTVFDNTQRFRLDYINVQENAASRHSIKSIQPFGHNRHGLKSGAAAAL